MNASDAALVERIAAGEEAALAELMDRYAGMLMRYATNFLRSADDADEVLQDTFLRAERAIRKGTRPERLESWLFRIAVNRCRSRRRQFLWLVTGDRAARVISHASSPPEAEGVEWNDEIGHALTTLRPAHREAFLLKHVEGLSYEEIAEITGVGIPALKMRVSRACERLRERLSDLR